MLILFVDAHGSGNSVVVVVHGIIVVSARNLGSLQNWVRHFFAYVESF